MDIIGSMDEQNGPSNDQKDQIKPKKQSKVKTEENDEDDFEKILKMS